MTIKPLLPIGIGTLPYKDPVTASEIILNYFPESPYWPQLPLKDWKEGILIQYTEGMPGLVLNKEKTFFHTPFHPSLEWESFYEASSQEDLENYSIGKEYGSGFYSLLELLKGKNPLLIKGQVTGPITLGLGLSDEKKIPIFYDPNLKEMILTIISLKARWQEKEFKKVVPEAETLIFFDEPILSGYGSISMNLGKEEIIECLKRVSSSLQGLSGIHICGATDWSIIIETGIDVIHFDAYQFFSNMLTYAPELKTFLSQNGKLGWGIVPSEEEFLKKESLPSLVENLKEKINLLVQEGIPEEKIMENSFISQSCGLASLSEELAEKALRLTADLSLSLKRHFKF